MNRSMILGTSRAKQSKLDSNKKVNLVNLCVGMDPMMQEIELQNAFKKSNTFRPGSGKKISALSMSHH